MSGDVSEILRAYIWEMAMNIGNVFSNARSMGFYAQIRGLKNMATNILMAVVFPLAVYGCAFYLGMGVSGLARSPLLHFVGSIGSLIINLCTLAVTFCIGFITGIFDWMRDSLGMFPFAQPQLRIVMGLVFLMGLLKRFFNVIAGVQTTFGFMLGVLVPAASVIAVIFGVNWMDIQQDLQLSSAEKIFTGLGYWIFYYFQSGKEIKIKRQRKPDWRSQ